MAAELSATIGRKIEEQLYRSLYAGMPPSGEMKTATETMMRMRATGGLHGRRLAKHANFTMGAETPYCESAVSSHLQIEVGFIKMEIDGMGERYFGAYPMSRRVKWFRDYDEAVAFMENVTVLESIEWRPSRHSGPGQEVYCPVSSLTRVEGDTRLDFDYTRQASRMRGWVKWGKRFDLVHEEFSDGSGKSNSHYSMNWRGVLDAAIRGMVDCLYRSSSAPATEERSCNVTVQNLSTAIFLVNDQVRLVRAKYEPDDHNRTGESKAYDWKTFDHSIKKDDIIVVPSTTRWGYTTAKVIEVDVDPQFESGIEYKWLVGKADLEGHKALIEQEKVLTEKVHNTQMKKRRLELRKDIIADNNGELDDLPMVTIKSDKVLEAPKPAFKDDAAVAAADGTEAAKDVLSGAAYRPDDDI